MQWLDRPTGLGVDRERHRQQGVLAAGRDAGCFESEVTHVFDVARRLPHSTEPVLIKTHRTTFAILRPASRQ